MIYRNYTSFANLSFYPLPQSQGILFVSQNSLVLAQSFTKPRRFSKAEEFCRFVLLVTDYEREQTSANIKVS